MILRTNLLVRIKAFGRAKGRLGTVLRPEERSALAQHMAARILHAGGALPVTVVCDEPAVASFAEAHGASVLWTPGLGLNQAVGEGVRVLGAQGATEVIVAHADLRGEPAYGTEPQG